MGKKLPPIYFYLPESDWPADGILPENIDTSWVWQVSHSSFINCKYTGMSDGVFSWVLQTYLRIVADGFPWELTKTIPDAGIIVAFRKSLPDDLKPSLKSLIVCI